MLLLWQSQPTHRGTRRMGPQTLHQRRAVTNGETALEEQTKVKAKPEPKAPIKYATFKEYCEWEGETWRFYIPLIGDNYANICWLETNLKRHGLSEFTVIHTEISKKEVDALCKRNSGGYMAIHNKLDGHLNRAEIEKAAATKESLSELLYKGGIKNLFKKA